jgi:predicted nucleic acid-binding protein
VGRQHSRHFVILRQRIFATRRIPTKDLCTSIASGCNRDFHPTRALADSAADFKARFKLSLADAFAAALAREKKAELVTGDPEFKPLDQELKIHWLK